jgi:D-alanyl-D-alanine dipeptidase
VSLDIKNYRTLKKRVLIDESNEEMVEIPSSFLRFSPHPYQIADAPYANRSPFFVREGVLERLFYAQKKLQNIDNRYKIKIYDGYRPIAVQKYMIEYESNRLSNSVYNLDYDKLDFEKQKVITSKVNSFWSPVENVDNNPPPHSTGGALDLTIVDEYLNELDMGTKIDELVQASKSDYFSKNSLYGRNRALLVNVMSSAGFTQLPTEWWHFSYGDQIWALDNNLNKAKYGMI